MDDKPRGKLASLLYVAIVPVFFTSVFCLIFIFALDIPVKQTLKDWGNNIPVVRDMIPGESSSQKNTIFDLKQELEEMNNLIADQKEELDEQQSKIKQLTKSNQRLKDQLTEKRSVEYDKQVKKVAEIYADIPASKAAAMIETLSIEEATLTISMLKQSQQSSILASMKDPKLAAKITMILKELALVSEKDPTVLQEKIQEIVQQQQQATP
ncbi:MotE family protein [Bacillus marasmi]|uniref:MotE family protein n=1 Tax=Bacillus marasmi TaxID=1926279 RepID=UPI0011CC959C|nr:hypothetical protein [Bacillus marasmi]